jgi:DNA-binding transcriptional MerR regulator
VTGSGDRRFLSIGEVLGVLQPEFPDVTISKIRFLESQGLIDPERTASGYRKFYDDDLARLRFILREQKDHFLPLKVIKDRLATNETGALPIAVAEPAARVPLWMRDRASPSSAVSPAAGGGTPPEPDTTVLADGAEVELTLEQLAAQSGLSIEQVREIESFGLIRGVALGRTVRYDAEALAVARLAAAFGRHGIEARHLRMYRNAAEKEAGLIEQAVLPLVKQRNPRARTDAATKLDELVSLGAQLHAVMVRAALAGVTEGR